MNKKVKIILVIVAAVVVAGFVFVWTAFAPSTAGGDLSETVSASELKAARKAFTTGKYKDAATNRKISYNLYVPENYDESKSYPMVVFLADAGAAGNRVKAPLKYNAGAAVWAAASEQADRPCFVLVPNYPQMIIDDLIDDMVSDYVPATASLIRDLEQRYSIDPDRVYGTGQAMGAQAVMYLAANDPDLFASTLIVDAWWNVEQLEGLKDAKFIYVAAGGDERAVSGQNEVKAMLGAAGIGYGEVSGLNAKAPAAELDEAIGAMLSENHDANFITWETGTVGETSKSNEHLSSFSYGFKSGAVREWLFGQEK